MALSHPLSAATFLPDAGRLRHALPPRAARAVVRPRRALAAAPRRERRLTLLLVVLAHVAGLYSFARLAAPSAEPLVPPITVALIEPPRPVAPPAPPTPPEPVRREVPPPTPKPVKAEPRPLSKPTPAPTIAPEPPPAAPTPASISHEAPPPPPAPAAVIRPEPPAPPVVVAARFDAAYLNNPAPAYPPLARRMREEGRVLLRVRVSAEGLPQAVQVNESSGSARLDNAAREGVERWRFVPARQDDKAVEAWVIVPIVFKLEGH